MTSTTASASGANIPLLAGGLFSLATFYSDIQQAIFDLRWALLFILILVVTDLVVGSIDNCYYQRQDFKWRLACRRSLFKILEYFCYITVGFVAGKAIAEPYAILTPIQCAGIGSGFALILEIGSVYTHGCSLHGYHNPPSIKSLFRFFFSKRTENLDWDALDNNDKQTNEDNQ